MSALTRFLYPVPALRSTGQIVLWWEKRCLAYNLVVGATGSLTLAVIAQFSLLPPNPHLMGPPPLFIVAYAVIANACYSLGWMLEGAAHTARLVHPGPPAKPRRLTSAGNRRSPRRESKVGQPWK